MQTVAAAVMRVHFRVCGTEHRSQTGQAITEPTLGTAMDLSHFKACNQHTNVQLARTISITRFLADILAVCGFFLCNTYMCVNLCWCLLFLSVCVYQEVWLTFNARMSLCLMDCCVIRIYLTYFNVQESSSIYYFLLFLLKEKDWKKKKEI